MKITNELTAKEQVKMRNHLAEIKRKNREFLRSQALDRVEVILAVSFLVTVAIELIN